MISRLDVEAAEFIIDTSGVVNKLIEGRKRQKRGRPADTRKYRLFLIGGMLNVMRRGNFVVSDVHRTLTEDLDMRDQFRLGVRERVETENGPETKILSVHDLYYVTKRLGHDLAYTKTAAPELDDTERARRHAVVRDYTDALLDVFDFMPTSNTYAIDASGMWSWVKGTVIKTDPTEEEQPDPGTAITDAA